MVSQESVSQESVVRQHTSTRSGAAKRHARKRKARPCLSCIGCKVQLTELAPEKVIPLTSHSAHCNISGSSLSGLVQEDGDMLQLRALHLVDGGRVAEADGEEGHLFVASTFSV